MLAENLWHGWHGDEKDPNLVEAMIELSELIIQYGFTDISRIDPESNETALARAQSRGRSSETFRVRRTLNWSGRKVDRSVASSWKAGRISSGGIERVNSCDSA